MMMRIGVTVALLLALAGCATSAEQPARLAGEALIRDRAGNPVGNARLLVEAGRLVVSANVHGLMPGAVHAVHLHTTGDCSAGDFTSAGGHLNPDGHQHGSLNPQGAHLGDLPNLTAGDNGGGVISAVLPGAAEQALGHIFDADGTAIIVHEAPDDYRTDPTGAAGARIACGVLMAR